MKKAGFGPLKKYLKNTSRMRGVTIIACIP